MGAALIVLDWGIKLVVLTFWVLVAAVIGALFAVCWTAVLAQIVLTELVLWVYGKIRVRQRARGNLLRPCPHNHQE